VIGVIIGQPFIAIPAALISHYVCDAIPHFKARGFIEQGDRFLKTGWFRRYLLTEASLCGVIVMLLAILQPVHWQLAVACAFLAASPDFFAFKRFKRANQGKKYKPGFYARFAGGIQWFERPIGAVVEAAWFVGALALLAPFLV
jgi:hypothetical protein